MKQVYNFCSGPAMLPIPVMIQAQQEFRDWNGMGASVMELSHRSQAYIDVAAQAEQDLRDLLAIPDHYKVLFLQGGARLQFAGIPLNLLGPQSQAVYLTSGQWSAYAEQEARKYCNTLAIDALWSDEQGRKGIRRDLTLTGFQDAAYLHYAPNETIDGIEFLFTPETDLPLVADMSSTLLSRPIDVSKFGLIYAGAQKNIGPSGLTVVIVREDLLGRASIQTPSVMNYQIQAEHDSMYNTPATYAWYLAGLVFKWLKDLGGLSKMAEINQRKAQKLYQYIDASGFYSNSVRADSRSWMNVPFSLSDESLNSAFLKESEAAGLLTLKGHRLVGGMRASIYNPMPEEGVDALLAFMQDFERKRG